MYSKHVRREVCPADSRPNNSEVEICVIKSFEGTTHCLFHVVKIRAVLGVGKQEYSSLDFSNCGRFLAAVTFGGEIGLWDAHTGKRYNPFLTSDSAGMSTTA
jgi:WD40 repeat protein